MNTLHVLLHYSDSLLARCMDALAEQDTLLLAGDAVFHHADSILSQNPACGIAALQEDLILYGIDQAACAVVTLEHFVTLTENHQRQIKWA